MSRYASKTDVSSDRSRAEIERTVTRYGACGFFYGWDGPRALIGFRIDEKHVRFELAVPDRNDSEFTETEAGKPRKESAALKSWEQACRQRWRALALVIKAKLEAVESGISSFESEFLAAILLPGGQTVGEHMIPQVEQAYLDGKMPPLLPYSGGKKPGASRRRAKAQ